MPTKNFKPGKHLPYQHPAVQHVRDWVRFRIDSGHFSPRLVANFDQVWCVLFRPKTSVLKKKKDATLDEHSRSMAMRKTRHCLERSLNLPLTEQFGPPTDPQVHPSEVSGGTCASVVVEQWRVPRTLCTLTWRDGTVGRGFLTCREGTLTESQRKCANEAGDVTQCTLRMCGLTCIYVYIYI